MNVLSHMTPSPSSPIHHPTRDIRSPRSPGAKHANRYTHTVSYDPTLKSKESNPSHVVKFSPYLKPTEPTPLELRWISKSMGRASHDDVKSKDAKMVSIYDYGLP